MFCNFIELVLFWLVGVLYSPHSVHKSHAGESEKFLREAFAEASSHAKSGKPSVIFIDEIDALCPRRDSRYDTTNNIGDGFMFWTKLVPTLLLHVKVVTFQAAVMMLISNSILFLMINVLDLVEVCISVNGG